MKKLIFWEILAAVILGTVLMTVVYSLPTEPMRRHVRDSLPLFVYEGDYPSWAKGADHAKLDNFTDAIMVMEAVYPSEDDPLTAALLNYNWSGADKTKTLSLKRAMESEGTLPGVIYSRYWHGYLLLLKPLLMITQVQYIRILNYYAVYILLLTALLLIYKKLGTVYAASFAFSMMCINLVTVSMSFQNSVIYYLLIISSIIVLKYNESFVKKNAFPYFFTAVGICTSFFDLLSYPVATLGFPLMFWYLLNRHSRKQNQLKTMLIFILAWGAGYAGMWAGKWCMVTLLTEQNIFADVLYQMGGYLQLNSRLADDGWQITHWSAVQANIAVMGNGPVRIFFFAGVIYLAAVLATGRKVLLMNRKEVAPYVTVAVLPLMVYLVNSGHSHIHSFFTYRALSVTIFAVLCFFIAYLQEKNRQKLL